MSSLMLSTVAKRPWVITEMETNRVTCEWTITKSELLSKENGDEICSPLFYSCNGKEQWRLLLYPRGRNETCANAVSCFLHLEASEILGIHAEYKISMLKSNRIIVEGTSRDQFNKVSEGWGWQNFIEQSKLFDQEFSDITITIHLNTGTEMPQKQWSENFRLLFKDPKFSDITIIVGAERFPAHKSILSVQSSVFAAMFNHEGMDENRTNEVKIEDLEPAVIEGMLEYIYTGQVANLEGLAKGLLAAAEKYDLGVLKTSCEDSLYKNLNVNNAAETLMLAHLYLASKLKESVMKFIKDNIHEVVETDGYKKINDNILLTEIILFCVQKNER